LAVTVENAAVFTKWVQGDPESTKEMPRIVSFSVNLSL